MRFSSPKFLAEILIEYGMFYQSVWHHTSGEEGDFFIFPVNQGLLYLPFHDEQPPTSNSAHIMI